MDRENNIVEKIKEHTSRDKDLQGFILDLFNFETSKDKGRYKEQYKVILKKYLKKR
jgi:hypothetical protein